MPVTGLPVAVEAVLDSLLAQYHLVSWQVTGGERSVVLTLRWSLQSSAGNPEPPNSPPPGSSRRRSPHRHGRHGGRSRRTSQWLLDQQHHAGETPDSTLERPPPPRQYPNHYSDPCDTTPPNSPHTARQQRSAHRPSVQREPVYDTVDAGNYGIDAAGNDGYYDYDSPPPLPPPPPDLFRDTNGSGGSGGQTDPTSESEADSRTTGDTVVENLNRGFPPPPPPIAYPYNTHQHRESLKHGYHTYTSSGDESTLGRRSSGSNALSARTMRRDSTSASGSRKMSEGAGVAINHDVPVYEIPRNPPLPQTQGNSQSQSQNDQSGYSGQSSKSEDESSRRRRYHFRELIRKHSDGIKELAAERRRKDNERERLREIETAKAKSRLKSQSEDNLLSKQNSSIRAYKQRKQSTPLVGSAKSEANVDSGAAERRVRFSPEANRTPTEHRLSADNNNNNRNLESNSNNTPRTSEGPVASTSSGPHYTPGPTTQIPQQQIPKQQNLQQQQPNPQQQGAAAAAASGDGEDDEGGGDDDDGGDDDSGGDSPDAEEFGQHQGGPRRLGAVFRISAMVARQKRRRKLVN